MKARSQYLAGLLLATLLVGMGFSPQSYAQCPETGSTDFFPYDAEEVQLISCSDEGLQGGNTSVTIEVPTGVGAGNGDLLVAVVQTDGANEDLDDPTDVTSTWDGVWTEVPGGYINAQGISSHIWVRVVDGTEAASYTFAWDSSEQVYGYILRFRGASGLFTYDDNNGDSLTPNSPDITALSDDSLILRMMSVDFRPIVQDTSPVPAGDTLITMESSRPSGGGGGATVSGGASYSHQATAGLTGTAAWANLTQVDEWHARTMAIEPMLFNISLDSPTSSVCGVSTVTLRVQDRLGANLDLFEGTVTITTSGTAASASAQWTDQNDVVTVGSSVTYTIDADDDGVAVFEYYTPSQGTVDFDITYENFSINTTEQLTVIDCEFVISYDDNQVETCAMEAATITLQDTAGNPATFYSGTLTINNQSGGTFGNYALSSGDFVLDNGTADDGIATYPFVITPDLPGTPNVVVVDYIHGSNSLADVDLLLSEDSGFGFVESGNPLMSVETCVVIATLPDADLTRDVCTVTSVTFEIQANGATVTTYAGNINLSAAVGLAGQGFWYDTPVPNPGTLTGGGVGDGTATYDFNGTEGGTVTLDFRNAVTATGLTFEADGITDDGITLSQSGAVPSIDIGNCTLTITTAAPGLNEVQVCRGPQSVTYTVTSPDGRTVTNYDALISLSVVESLGDYAEPGGGNPGTLNNIGLGSATYQLDPTEGGVFTLEYSNDVGAAYGALTGFGNDTELQASSTGITLVNTDGTLSWFSCVFEIEFQAGGGFAANATDVCSIKQVRITVVDNDDVDVTDYTGQIFLSTSTGFGSWAADGTANGTLVDVSQEDGQAAYTFDALDAGSVLLDFTHTAGTATALNVNVTDLVTTDLGTPGDAIDPNLNIANCYFEISFSGGVDHLSTDMTACQSQAVTIEVYNSLNAIASDYAGRIDITTDTDNGNWAINTGNGALSNVVVDGGSVSYTFQDDGAGGLPDDDGVVTLDYSNLNAETVNFNVVDFIVSLGVDGPISEDGAADPSIEIGSCIPTVAAQVCGVGAGPSITLALTIDAQNPVASLQGRKVVVATMHEVNTNTSDVDVSSVQFDRDVTAGTDLANFAELIEERAIDNFELTGNLFEMREATGLPTAAGTYDIIINHNDSDNLAACAFYLTDVEQVDLVETVPADDGPLNATNYTDDGAVDTQTTITTTANNALILSIGGQGANGGTWDGRSPSPPLAQLFAGPNPSGSTFGGSSGNLANAAAVTVSEQENGNSFRVVHLVAAFNPIISGPPVAVGYVPVTLIETYAGNLSYRAIGNSLLSTANGSACNFVGASNDPLTVSSATLTLPDTSDASPFSTGAGEFDSDVVAAYLYWFGSGSFDDPFVSGNPAVTNTVAEYGDYDTVRFTAPDGTGGFNTTTLSATVDELFIIDNAGAGGDWDFYAAFKDVTSLIVGTNNEGTGSDENPNGLYSVDSIGYDLRDPWDDDICVAGWSLIVVYENPYEQLRVVNLFHGFQPFQNSSFTLVPRNFRMAERDATARTPNGQITHVTVEGDTQLTGVNEGLTLQTDPANTDPASFTPLLTPFNPEGEEFNGTITRPFVDTVTELNTLADVVAGGVGGPEGTGPITDYAYVFNESLDVGDDPAHGYELDFPEGTGVTATPPDYDDGTQDVYGLSFGVDIDTHYIEGDTVGDVLYNFADPLDLAEEITSEYSADQDLVLLVSEVISVTNDDIADIEVTITENDAEYKVGSVGVADYNIEVRNNGSGGTSFGQASGFIELVGELPTGYNLNTVSGTGWTCSTSIDSTSAFTCTNDIPDTAPNWLDESNPTLEDLTLVVDIDAPPTNFPSLTNNAKVIVRVQHQDDDNACRGVTVGVLPTPTNACRAPEFDNVNDLQGGVIDINDVDDKAGNNNNVDSITTVVRGIETDIKVEKVSSVLVEGTNDVTLYTITVTNNGPDDIESGLVSPPFSITVTDNEPTDLNFDSASGTGWACSVDTVPNPDLLTCNFSGDLDAGLSSVITIVGDVAAATAGNPVSNTVQVDTGLYNFDVVPGAPGENSDTDNTSIQATPPIISDRFLFSVSAAAANNLTSIGGLANFTDNDIVFYNPSSDTAELFIDSANTVDYSVDDPNALHLLPSGLVVLSANTDNNDIGTGAGAVNFDRTDLVLYNRITNSAQLLFDGSVITDQTGGSIPVNIDSVYVINDGTDGNPVEFVFSTAGAASGPQLGGGTLNWSDSDLVRYDGTTGEFELYLDAEDDNVFDANDAQVDATYIRVDPADATALDDVFVFSSEVATILGDDNISFGLDDLAELDITGGTAPSPTTTESELLFRGNLPVGIFTTSEADLKINALHLIEPNYLGRFEISEATEGNACTPARIRIRKLEGNSSNTDVDYTGTIIISTDTGDGIWTVDSGTPANLTNNYTAGTIGQTPPAGDTNNGDALYTFDASDNGEIILTLNVDVSSPPVSVNISITRGFESFVDVLPDVNNSPFDFNEVVQTVEYQDNFETVSFSNNDGNAGWSSDWVEVDAFDGSGPGSGAGLATGNVQMTGGKLSLSSNVNTNGSIYDPSMTRSVGLGLFNRTEPVVISYLYGFSNVTNGADTIELQVNTTNNPDDLTWVTVASYSTLDGSSGSDLSDSVDITTIPAADAMLDAIDLDSGAPNDLFVRWKITQGYVLGTFTVDEFKVATGTTDCDISGLSHYSIIIPDNGLACVTSTIRIEAQDAFNNLVAPGAGTMLTITVDNGAGSWVNVVGGTGTLSNNTVGTGQATYVFPAGEDFVELAFNYTDPRPIIDGGDGPTFNIDVTDGTYSELSPSLDPTGTWAEAGIAFYDQTNLSYSLPMQIAGKPSQTAPAAGDITLQLVRSVPIAGENAAAACESLIDDGNTATIDLVGVCIDPAGCDVATMSIEDVNSGLITIPVVDGTTPNPLGFADPVDLTFTDRAIPIPDPGDGEANIGATLDFTYADAGKIEIHAEYEIPLNNDIAGTLSGNTITGSSNTFIVRPFGFDIDFSNDRAGGGTASLALNADGPAFARAGVGFSTTVSAVVWESADDTNDDGIPDASADLSNNAVTTNFDDAETTGITTSTVEITIGSGAGVPDSGSSTGVAGSLIIDAMASLSDIFQGFSGGQTAPQNIAIDEVGIFDLSAQLVDDDVGRNPITYFDESVYTAAESVAGNVVNVGRIYPNNFEATMNTASWTPRINQGMCAMSSPFNYLGEEFEIIVDIQAKNAYGDDTLNYFGDFAKITTLAELDIRAIQDVAGSADVDLSGRLEATTFPSAFDRDSFDTGDDWTSGRLLLSGNFRLNRQASGAEEAPFELVRIGFAPIDNNINDGAMDDLNAANDVLLDFYNLDIDDGITEPGTFVLQHFSDDPDPEADSANSKEFRYGRLIVENAVGPETEDLPIAFRVEYFDGANFVTNTADNCTSIIYDVDGSPALTFIANSYLDDLDPGETVIENGQLTDVEINVFGGITNRTQDGDNDDSNDADRPLITSAPDPEGDDEFSGQALVEFDLSAGTLSTPLDFLGYDWRGDAAEDPMDPYDEIPDGDYNDFPRAIIEFGSYRGHDRVINWQELFITN